MTIRDTRPLSETHPHDFVEFFTSMILHGCAGPVPDSVRKYLDPNLIRTSTPNSFHLSGPRQWGGTSFSQHLLATLVLQGAVSALVVTPTEHQGTWYRKDLMGRLKRRGGDYVTTDRHIRLTNGSCLFFDTPRSPRGDGRCLDRTDIRGGSYDWVVCDGVPWSLGTTLSDKVLCVGSDLNTPTGDWDVIYRHGS